MLCFYVPIGGRRKVDDVLKALGDSDCGPWTIDSSSEGVTNETIAQTSKVEEVEDATPAVSKIEGDVSGTAAGIYIVEPEEEDEKWEKVNERKMSSLLPPRQARGSQVRMLAATLLMLCCYCAMLTVILILSCRLPRRRQYFTELP